MSSVGHLGEIVIDVSAPDVDHLVGFWCSLLGVTVDARDAEWIDLTPQHPDAPHLSFQVVPEPKAVKNRVHLDVYVDELGRATEAAEALGATLLGDAVQEEDSRFQVLADPAGNEVCLVEWST
ncbi:MAG: VOC family protein [Actinobacteria bacterium]|nr:VOC family protein [Actinomycetota bacterium]